MRVYLRLAEVLNVDENDAPRIRQLAKEIGLHYGQLRYLLNQKNAGIRFDQLSKITAYVAEVKNIRPDEVFGMLFAVEPTKFWHLLAERSQVTFFEGIRTNPALDDIDLSFADHLLQVTAVDCVNRVLDADHPSPLPSFGTCHAWDLDGSNHAAVRREARKKYEAHRASQGDMGLFCIGSIKSNPIVELVFARAFPRATAFQSEDGLSTAAERSCPFFLKYRDGDPKPESCAAGSRLCLDTPGKAPGIYYETRYGDEWQCVEWDAATTDVALVFYCFYKSRQQLDMAACGYSGRATWCLADLFRNREGHRLWPPVYSDRQVLIGAYIVKLIFNSDKKGHVIEGTPYRAADKFEIIPLAAETIERRRQPRTSKRKTKPAKDQDAAGQPDKA